jgi:hypothetical protein
MKTTVKVGLITLLAGGFMASSSIVGKSVDLRDQELGFAKKHN